MYHLTPDLRVIKKKKKKGLGVTRSPAAGGRRAWREAGQPQGAGVVFSGSSVFRLWLVGASLHPAAHLGQATTGRCLHPPEPSSLLLSSLELSGTQVYEP